ncbi:hypothetical protein QFZ35_002663 [Arthrobacter ulcerisalmonis]|nr:hypothetical protein [Arthrobacter ulcerisalmonis]
MGEVKAWVDGRPLAGADGHVAGSHCGGGRFEHRCVHHPAESPGAGIDQTGPVADFHARRTQQGTGRCLLAGGEEDAVAGLGAHCPGQAGTLGVGQVFGNGSGQFAVFLEEDVGQALMAALLGELLPAVQGAAGLGGTARHHDGTNIRCLEDAEVGVLEEFGEFGEFNTKTEVGLVRAVTGHCIRVGDPLDGRGDLDVDQLPQCFDDGFAQGNDVVLVHEARLDVQLGEFRLAVGAEVLVPVAAGNLVVLLETAHLQELLEKLRRLRQGVPGTRGKTGRDHKVARPFGRRTRQRGGLDFHKAVLVEDFPGHPVGLGTQAEVAAGARTTQIQVAVLEPGFLADLHVLVDLERERVRSVEDDHLVGHHFNFASRQGRVLIALGAP